VDGASLAFARIAFGLIVLWETWRYAEKGWIHTFYVKPAFTFTYYGFDWVQPWPGDGMYLHFFVLAILAVFVAAGLFHRVACALLFLAFTYVFLLDQTRYLNHFYVVSILALLLACVPASNAISLDARFGITRAAGFVPAWSVWLLRTQLSIVYAYAGIAKLDRDWLQGEPMRSWLANRTSFPVIGRFFDTEWAVVAFTWGGFLFDLSIAPLLLWRRTRPYAFVAAALFHWMNDQLFTIGIFPWLMIAVSTLYFDPGWPRRVFAFLQRSATAAPELPRRRAVLVIGGVFLALQLLVPLRHLLYPGVVAWTEEGHRFSWRMKLRDKDGTASFRVRDAASGDEWVESLSELSKRQRSEMATHPDMLLQYAHRISRKYAAKGQRVMVFATAKVSLNGREPHLLVDPGVDLAAEPRTLGHVTWIRPLESEAAIHTETPEPDD